MLRLRVDPQRGWVARRVRLRPSLPRPPLRDAGVALAAYAARAGLAARVYAPATTPPAILGQIRSFGGDLALVDGHIGDCGKAARTRPRLGPWTCPRCASPTASRARRRWASSS